MILDSPVAVSDEENDGREYENIVLFELKRPMRDDYNSSNNPVNQLYEYVSQLRSNKKRDKDGRVIRVGQNTKFYLYAVCDITTTLEQILDFHDFSQTPDKLGYYKYNDKMNAYIEILWLNYNFRCTIVWPYSFICKLLSGIIIDNERVPWLNLCSIDANHTAIFLNEPMKNKGEMLFNFFRCFVKLLFGLRFI